MTASDPKTSRAAEAGQSGSDIRSDVHVSIEPRESGGLAVGLESRVAPYYGEAILTQTRHVLETLGVKNARVAIHDEGALPYVIAARIETAVRRAGLANPHQGVAGTSGAAGLFRQGSSSPLETLSAWHRTEVHDQRGFARPGCDHSRPRRFRPARRERRRPHPGPQCTPRR